MPLRISLLTLGAIAAFATTCTSAWAQAPAQTKKPPTAPTAPQSKHFPILLLASGNNPAWSVRVGQKGPERLDRPGYPPITLEPADIIHEASGDAWTYHAKDTGTGAVVALHLSREACSDAMSATKYTFRVIVEHAQLGTLNGCARIAAELFPRITNQDDEDPDDAAKKKPALETTITGFKPPTAMAYLNSAGRLEPRSAQENCRARRNGPRSFPRWQRATLHSLRLRGGVRTRHRPLRLRYRPFEGLGPRRDQATLLVSR